MAASRQTSPEKKRTTQSHGTTAKSAATGSKKTASSGSRALSGSRSRKKKKKISSAAFNEAALFIALAVALILFISNFGLAGKFGTFFEALQFGTFGVLAYIFPPELVLGTYLMMRKGKKSGVARVKFITAFIGSFFVCAFIEMINGAYKSMEKLSGYYNFAVPVKKGGGIIGGSICSFLTPAVGKVGAYIIIVVFIIIAILIISERSILKGLSSGSRKVFKTAKDDICEYKEESEKKRVQREEAREQEITRRRRFDQKVSGVDFSIEIPRERRDVDTADRLPQAENMRRRNSGIAGAEVEEVFQNDRYSENIIDISPENAVSGSVISLKKRKNAVTAKPVTPDVKENMNEVSEAGFKPDVSEITEYKPQDDYTGYEASEEKNEQTYSSYGEHLQELPEDDGMEQWSRQAEVDAAGRAVPENIKRQQPAQPEKSTAAEVRKSVEPQASKNKEPERTMEQVDAEIDEELRQSEELNEEIVEEEYKFPPVELLHRGRSANSTSDKELHDTAMKLQQTLSNFGVRVTVSDVSCGPAVTRYEIQPEQGVKVSRIVSLADDIKLNLAAADIRIEAPIPGKAAVGIEVPNKETSGVTLRELIESKPFEESKSPIAFGVGKDIAGQVVVADIAKMPHVLIAGATGSGKSVCINTIIMSILFRAKPSEVKLIMIDPKVVELSVYNGIPHLMIPVVTDSKKAAGALNWAVAEMDDRYKKFAQAGVRDLKGYNAKIEQLKEIEAENKPARMPQLVIIIDELADLMMIAKNEVEDAIVRLAQLARAAGIHLVIATQRPSVDVITGLIKANVPSRIAFAVSSGVDSRTILDMVGAEKLLGKGDMLFSPAGYPKPARIQGAFVSDDEVSAVVEFLKANCGETGGYHNDVAEKINNPAFAESQAFGNDYDDYFAEAGRYLIEKGKGSVSILQRVYRIGFNRAARIMDQLEEAGVMGPEEGTKPRKVLMSMEEFEELLAKL